MTKETNTPQCDGATPPKWTKETYVYDKRDLRIRQKRPICTHCNTLANIATRGNIPDFAS